MTRIILCGANGKMGRVIQSVVSARENCKIVAGVDFNTESISFPIYKSLADVTEEADVIIDFSNPALLENLLNYSINKNMPVGINLLANLAKKAVSVLGGDFDIEIVEKHHNQKIDAPSGTALMLADAICEEIEKPMNYEYDRHSKREKRTKDEIGLHAIRGGTIVGEHDIIFAGRDEIITLSHSARSKEIFAVGAVNAAVFMADNKAPGMYTMKEMID